MVKINTNKKIIMGVLIIVLIIVIGVIITYKVIEKRVINKEDFNSNPVDTVHYKQNDTKSNRTPSNVIIKVENNTIKPESVSITITDNNENQYSWGVEFRVQEKVNEKWKDLEYIADNLSWIDIAYVLNEDKQLIQKLDIEKDRKSVV